MPIETAPSVQKIETATRYALALQESLDDAETMLEPLLPAEAQPYVEMFERSLLARADRADGAIGTTGSRAPCLEPLTGVSPRPKVASKAFPRSAGAL